MMDFDGHPPWCCYDATGRPPLQDHWNSQRCLGSSRFRLVRAYGSERTGEFADHDKKLSAAVNGSGYNVAG
jgi:hypothetical protein